MVDHIFRIVGGELVCVFQRDCASGTGCLAVATEDATQHIDIEDAGVALTGGDAILLDVLLRLDVDGVGGAGACAEVAAHAAFKAVLVAMQDMPAPEARRQLALLFWIRDGGWLAPYILQGG